VRNVGMKGEKTTLIGAVIAGALASACCLGPLIIVFLGLGSASLFIAMEPYRPLFALLTLSLVGVASWRHRQGKKQCLVSGCAPKKPVMLWMLGGFAVLLLILPALLPYLIQ